MADNNKKDVSITFSNKQRGKTFEITRADGTTVERCRISLPSSSQFKGYHILHNPNFIYPSGDKTSYIYLNPDYPVTIADKNNDNEITLSVEDLKAEFNSYRNKDKVVDNEAKEEEAEAPAKTESKETADKSEQKKDISISFSKRQIGKPFHSDKYNADFCRVYLPNSSQYKSYHVLVNAAYIRESSEKSCYTYFKPDFQVEIRDSKNENGIKLSVEELKAEFDSFRKEKTSSNEKAEVENDFDMEDPEEEAEK